MPRAAPVLWRALFLVSSFLIIPTAEAQDEKAWPQATDQDFSFRGILFGVPLEKLPPGFICEQSDKNPEEKNCTFKDFYYYEQPAVVSITTYKKVPFEFRLSTNLASAKELVKAFRDKYGDPCKDSADPLSPKARGLMWCFRYGPLLLFKSNEKLPAQFRYEDGNVWKRYPKVVDF